MKLLLDANISWRLVSTLKKVFEDCFHVDFIELSIPPPTLKSGTMQKKRI